MVILRRTCLLGFAFSFVALASTAKYKIQYTVSAGMPLSLKGLPLIKKIAEEKGYVLEILNDPVMPLVNSAGELLFPLLKKNELNLHRGLFLHYPSTLLLRNGVQCGAAVPGYKSLEAFEEIISILRSECFSIKPIHSKSQNMPLTITATLLRELKLPRKIAYYFRPINDEWITYHTGAHTYLYSLNSGNEILFQGMVDSIPSPDGTYLTLPSKLRFFSLSEIFKNPSDALQLQPVLTDETMDDQYQSVGVLEGAVYRVLTAWNNKVVSRDYQSSSETLQPLEAKHVVCNPKRVATPILSKNGQLLASYNYGPNGTDTTQIYKIGKKADICKDILDVGQRTGKVDFSHDEKFIVYMATNDGKTNLGLFVTRVNDGATYLVEEMNENESLTFPSFLPNGNVLVLRIQNNEFKIQEFALSGVDQ